MAFKSGDLDMDPMRGREKAEKGGVPDPGYAKKPTKNWDDDASYTRPETGPSPYEWIYEDEQGKEEADY